MVLSLAHRLPRRTRSWYCDSHGAGTGSRPHPGSLRCPPSSCTSACDQHPRRYDLITDSARAVGLAIRARPSRHALNPLTSCRSLHQHSHTQGQAIEFYKKAVRSQYTNPSIGFRPLQWLFDDRQTVERHRLAPSARMRCWCTRSRGAAVSGDPCHPPAAFYRSDSYLRTHVASLHHASLGVRDTLPHFGTRCNTHRPFFTLFDQIEYRMGYSGPSAGCEWDERGRRGRTLPVREWHRPPQWPAYPLAPLKRSPRKARLPR